MLYDIIAVKTIPKLFFAHIYSCPCYKQHFKKTMPSIEIVYVESGVVELEIMEQRLTVPEKSFLILPHKYDMTYTALGNSSHVHRTIAFMRDAEDVKLVTEVPQDLPDEYLCLPIMLAPCSQTEALLEQLNHIINEYQYAGNELKCSALVLQLLCDIAGAFRNQIAASSKKKRTDILDNRIKNYIQKNIDQKITLADIAEIVGKNPNYLNQVFRRKNNMSIISYVNFQKMQQAALLIVNEGLSVREAAKQVGIADVNYFSRLFKEKMGMTVSEYKENLVEKSYPLRSNNTSH